jgi:hypothetical protein
MSRYSKRAFTESAEFRNDSLFAPFLALANNDNGRWGGRYGPLGISCPDGDETSVDGAIPAPWIIAAMRRGAA